MQIKLKVPLNHSRKHFFHRGSDYSVVHEKMHTELEIVASRGDGYVINCHGDVINCHGEVLPYFL